MNDIIHSKQSIETELIEIINHLFNLKLNEDYLYKPLLGKDIKLNARDLVYLYFEIKKKWNIDISEHLVATGKFHTINFVSEIIKEQLRS